MKASESKNEMDKELEEIEQFNISKMKPSLEEDIKMRQNTSDFYQSTLPVTPVDEFFKNVNIEASKGTVKTLMGE